MLILILQFEIQRKLEISRLCKTTVQRIYNYCTSYLQKNKLKLITILILT